MRGFEQSESDQNNNAKTDEGMKSDGARKKKKWKPLKLEP